MPIIPLELAEAWPESEEAAYAAVGEARAKKAAAGGSVISETHNWNRHEYILATGARIPVIKGIAQSFNLGILKIVGILWPPAELQAELQRLTASTSAETFEPEVLNAASSASGDAPNAT